MPFIPGYEYDIYISFVPDDPVSITGHSDSWTEQFCKDLNLMLARRNGNLDRIKICPDNKKTDTNKVFEEQDDSSIQKSAILICLNSAGYAESANCKMELEIFYKKARLENVGLKIGNRSRILHVLLNHIPNDKWPEELAGTNAIHFFNAKEPADPGQKVEPGSAAYKKQMHVLLDAVWKLLIDFSTIRSEGAAPRQFIGEENKKPFTIYLGEVADTLRTSRKRVIAELTSKGYQVLTGVPPPHESSAHELATNEALKKADISIHLLDEIPGCEIAGDSENWYPKKQTEISLRSDKPQMIWVSEQTNFSKIEEEKYKLFLASLENGNTTDKSYEFIRGPKCTLTQDIIDFAEHAKMPQANKKSATGKVSVMLDTHFSDQQYAIALGKILLENHIQPFINPQEDDPRKNIRLMGERLSQVNKLIFLYGSVSKEWVRERMSAALELIITNNYPIEDFYIFMAPPLKEPINIFIDQRFLNISVIDSSRNINMNKNDLQYFLKALNTGKA
jgi:hypothetical protein